MGRHDAVGRHDVRLWPRRDVDRDSVKRVQTRVTSTRRRYCPPGDLADGGLPRPCPEGYYCASQRLRIVRARRRFPPAGPQGSKAPVLCPEGAYCPAESGIYNWCPLGYQNGVGSNNTRTSVTDSCAVCPAGTHGAHETRAYCPACTAGYVCLGETKSATPTDYHEDNGYACPAGSYCPEGSSVETQCATGKYNPESLSFNASACLPCAEGAYQDQPGKPSCKICSSTSTAEGTGNAKCTCLGLNRAFQSSGLCPCNPGYEWYDPTTFKASTENGEADCQPEVYARCMNDDVRDHTGACTGEGDCGSQCGSGGKRNIQSGVCVCDGMQTLDEECDEGCRTAADTVTYDAALDAHGRRRRNGYSVEAGCGPAAAAARRFRGGGSRPRRGCHADIPWRWIAPPPVETRRGPAAAATRTFRGDEVAAPPWPGTWIFRGDGSFFLRYVTTDANGNVTATVYRSELDGTTGSITCSGSACAVASMTVDASSFAGNYGAGATLNEARRRRRKRRRATAVEANATSGKRSVLEEALASHSRRLEEDDDDGAAADDASIANPVVCIAHGTTMLFDVSNDNYPVYVTNSLLNSNDDFDYSAFTSLQETAQSTATVASFAFTFDEAGLYVFSLSSASDVLTLVPSPRGKPSRDGPRPRRGRGRGYSVVMRRGAAAAAAWIVRGGRARARSRGEGQRCRLG